MAKFQFPKDFYWGAATAAYQVEGGIYNTDWAQAAEEGRVPTAGLSSDHYHRYEEDFDILKGLGHNAHRLGIEWARIEPQEGQFDLEAIEHYRQVLKALRLRDVEPFVTLWHFTLPSWFADSGGFLRADAPEVFARYCAFVVEELGDLCTHYATLNEPMVVASQGYLIGQFPPFKRVPFVGHLSLQDRGKSRRTDVSIRNVIEYYRLENALAQAHVVAYNAIKKVKPKVEVGLVKHTVVFHSVDNPVYKPLVAIMNWYWTYRFMNKVVKKCDSIGLNYYQHRKFGERKEYSLTDMGWQIYPEGIEQALKILWKYRKPIYISEAGCADAKDAFRADYITRQIQGVARAMKAGVLVKGHMYWSLLDNYEWALGYEKRFGLVEINYETLERRVRDSALVYKRIIEENAIELD